MVPVMARLCGTSLSGLVLPSLEHAHSGVLSTGMCGLASGIRMYVCRPMHKFSSVGLGVALLVAFFRGMHAEIQSAVGDREKLVWWVLLLSSVSLTSGSGSEAILEWEESP
jgi:hypothetical protein